MDGSRQGALHLYVAGDSLIRHSADEGPVRLELVQGHQPRKAPLVVQQPDDAQRTLELRQVVDLLQEGAEDGVGDRGVAYSGGKPPKDMLSELHEVGRALGALKPCKVLLEVQGYHPQGAVPMLGDDYLRHVLGVLAGGIAPLPFIPGDVLVLAVDEGDDVGILLDAAALAEV